MDYIITRQKDNSFLLTHKGIPSARITIAPSGKVTFWHDKVNIDGDAYTLSIKATKR